MTDKQLYITRSLAKLTHKPWELFTISRILHKLDDDDIEFVMQQYVRRANGSRALTDLYFPQFALHLEVDEPHHEKTSQRKSDHLRELDIVEVTDHDIERIKIADPDVDPQIARPMAEIKRDIDAFVERVREKKRAAVAEGTFSPWDMEKRYAAEPVIEKGSISIADNVAFKTQVEALRCFGFTGRGYQRGAWRIKDGSNDWVWFPRLFPHGLWINELSEDGKTISERAMGQEGIESIAKQRADYEQGRVRQHIVFAKAKDALGQNVLRFVGCFEIDLENSGRDVLRFNRKETEVPVRV
jgi:hypothetical protein